jgi:hypothetical protein
MNNNTPKKCFVKKKIKRIAKFRKEQKMSLGWRLIVLSHLFPSGKASFRPPLKPRGNSFMVAP